MNNKDIPVDDLSSQEKENLHTALFHQALDAIMIMDFNGKLLDVNESTCRQFGYTREELLGANVSIFLNDTDLIANPIRYDKILTGTQTFNERKAYHKDGHVVYIETNAKKYGDDKVIVIAHDVSDRVRKFDLLRKSEKDVRAILEHTEIAFVLLDADLRIVAFNNLPDSTLRQIESEHFKEGAPFIDSVSPDRREMVLSFLKDVLKGNRHEYETTYDLPDGTQLCLLINELPVIESDGSVLGICISVYNITDRKKAETELKRSEANLQSIFQTTDTAYILVDKNFYILSFNEQALIFCDKEFSQRFIPGTYLFDYFPPSRKAEWESHTPEVFKGKTVDFETCYTQADGSEQWYHKKLFPVYDSENNILGIMLSANDITKRKELAGAMEHQMGLLKELSFITSHELRHEYAKLHSIVNLLNEDGRLNAEEQELVVEGINSFNRINSIIYKLNDKITFGRVVSFDNTVRTPNKIEKILLVDDDSTTNKLHAMMIGKDFPREHIQSVCSVDEAISYLKQHDPAGNHLILLDLNMPEKTGWDFLQEYQDFAFHSPVIILSSSIDQLEKAQAKQYPFVKNFFSKPLQRTAIAKFLKQEFI